MYLEIIETIFLVFCSLGAFLSKGRGQLSEGKEYPVDPETFRLFQQGDQKAAEEIVTRCYDGMVAYLWAQTGSRDTAEDLAQECFLRLYQNRKRIYDEARVLPWLYQTARRLVVEVKRREARKTEFVSKRDDEVHTFCEDGLSRAVTDDLGKVISTVLTDLKPEEQQLITLKYFSGLKVKEIAETMSMPQGSVGVKLGRALKRFEKALARRGFKKEDLL